MEPVFVRSSCIADFCNVVMHSFIVIYFLQNAELDLQQEELK